MHDEHWRQYVAMCERINLMGDEEIEALIDEDRCPYEPEWLLGTPMGMFHCPVCGDMVLAGMPHPKRETAPRREPLG